MHGSPGPSRPGSPKTTGTPPTVRPARGAAARRVAVSTGQRLSRPRAQRSPSQPRLRGDGGCSGGRGLPRVRHRSREAYLGVPLPRGTGWTRRVWSARQSEGAMSPVDFLMAPFEAPYHGLWGPRQEREGPGTQGKGVSPSSPEMLGPRREGEEAGGCGRRRAKE